MKNILHRGYMSFSSYPPFSWPELRSLTFFCLAAILHVISCARERMAMMTKNVPGNVATLTKLLVLLLAFIAWFIILGLLSDYMPFELWLDLIIAGLIVLISAGLYLYVPPAFKIHLSGIIIFMILMLLLISVTDVVIQLFLIFFIVANVIYLVFYHGIYTACIDQAREEGISSEEYIKDFNMETKEEGKPQKGFLLKGKQAAGGVTDA